MAKARKLNGNTSPAPAGLDEIMLQIETALSTSVEREKMTTAKKLELTLKQLLQLVPALSSVSLADFLLLLSEREESLNTLLNRSKRLASVKWI